jgi:hypothetical protein
MLAASLYRGALYGLGFEKLGKHGIELRLLNEDSLFHTAMIA